jgi:hypothetical protein
MNVIILIINNLYNMTSDGLTDKLLTYSYAEILIQLISSNNNNQNNSDTLNIVTEESNRLEETINFSSVTRIDSNQIIVEEKSENNYSTCTNSKKY